MGRTSAVNRGNREAAALTHDRNEAMKEMNPATRKKLQKIEKLLESTRESNLRYYHSLGQEMIEVLDNPDTYTEKGCQQIESALGTHARVLRKARQFARCYSDKALEALIKKAHPETGFQLHWGHLSYLLSVESEKGREAWVERAINKMWDPQALHAAIKKKVGKRGSGGRPHKLPATVHGQIRQVLEMTRNWSHKATNLWNGEETNIFANITNEPPDDLAEADLENLDALIELLPQMRELTTVIRREAETAAGRIRKILAERQQAEQAAAETAEEHGREQRSLDLGGGRKRRAAPAA